MLNDIVNEDKVESVLQYIWLSIPKKRTRMKTDNGVAIFTTKCRHSFQF